MTEQEFDTMLRNSLKKHLRIEGVSTPGGLYIELYFKNELIVGRDFDIITDVDAHYH